MAVDVRILKSARRPVSDRKMKGLGKQGKAKAHKRKKTRQSMRFWKDMDSDWTAEKDQSLFGMKKLASCDVKKAVWFYPPRHRKRSGMTQITFNTLPLKACMVRNFLAGCMLIKVTVVNREKTS
ncbi:MAG: hypothetical protein JRC86_06005 [Deltaproteobacteria bacterium]|nr:hypothetical protein [Deltaproteobacteria bacterium]